MSSWCCIASHEIPFMYVPNQLRSISESNDFNGNVQMWMRCYLWGWDWERQHGEKYESTTHCPCSWHFLKVSGFCVALVIQGGSRERCYVYWLHILGVWPKANNQTTNFTDFYKTGLKMILQYHGTGYNYNMISHPSHLSIEWITWCGRFHSWRLDASHSPETFGIWW